MVPKENVVIFGPQIPHAHLFKDGGKAIFHRENQASSVRGENGNGGSLGQGSVFLSEELEHGSLGSAVPWGGLAAGAQSPLCTGGHTPRAPLLGECVRTRARPVAQHRRLSHHSLLLLLQSPAPESHTDPDAEEEELKRKLEELASNISDKEVSSDEEEHEEKQRAKKPEMSSSSDDMARDVRKVTCALPPTSFQAASMIPSALSGF